MIKIAVCDNDEKERKSLVKMIEDIMTGYGVLYRIYEFIQGEALLKTNLDFHLVFLEAVLAEEDGIYIGSEIYRRNHRIKIIFQTNGMQYCKEAMNRSHAFAYLEKPLIKEEAGKQIEEFLKSVGNIQEEKVEFEQAVYVHRGGYEKKRRICLLVRDIMYFGYLKNQKSIKIVTRDAQYIYKSAMNVIEDRMRPFGFETSCRGILVNLQNVVKIQGYEIILKNEEKVVLSQKRVKQFKARLHAYIHCTQARM